MFDLFQPRLERLLVLMLLIVVAPVATAQTVAQADNLLSSPLTLSEAEQLALGSDPLLRRFDALATALEARAVADGQWPDPQLRLGLDDIPVDDLSADIADTGSTELELALQQSFPAGNSLRYQSDQTLALAGAEQARRAEQRRGVLRGVRYNWLEVYDQAEAAQLLRETQRLFSHIVEITQSQFGAGFVTQQDVLGAELELNLLEDRETGFETGRQAALAELTQWTGPLERPLAEDWPTLPPIPTRTEIEAGLDDHPLMQVEDALVRAGLSGVDIAREQYKPAWSAEIRYDVRGDGRDDFLGAFVTFELPIFTDKRQDRRLAASVDEVSAARYSRDDRRRELRRILETEYAAWKGLGERLTLYEQRLLPQTAQNAEAALNAYQSNITDFSTLMRARVSQLEARLEALHLRVHRAQAGANLLYLAGEQP